MRPNIAVLRSAVGPMLTETGTVKRATGRSVQDPNTGLEAPEVVVVYAGPVLVRPQAPATVVVVGGVSVPVSKLDVTFPAESDVLIGDKLTVTTAPFDPALIGVQLKITDVPLDAWQVARFCLAERGP